MKTKTNIPVNKVQRENSKEYSVRVNGYAKINLALEVLRKLPNGYHEVRMIMQQLGLHDVVSITSAAIARPLDGKGRPYLSGDHRGGNIQLTTTRKDLPTDERNIAYRAAKLVKDSYKIAEAVTIHIEKRIPVAAGLAGGSTDAAAVLMGMNEVFNLDLTMETLCRLGARLGADVPFCIMGGAALAEGIGEKITPIHGLPRNTAILLCTPPLAISTKEVYEKLGSVIANRFGLTIEDRMKKVQSPVDNLRLLLKEGAIDALSPHMVNVLELVTAAEYPVIEEIKATMKHNGASAVLMSGSGPTVFGLFHDLEQAESTCELLKKQYPETFLTSPVAK